MLYFIKRSLTCLTTEIFVPLYSVLVQTSSRICHPSKLSIPQKNIKHLERIQRTATRWVKGLRGLSYEERLQALKNRRLNNDLVLTHKILYNHIDLGATQLFSKVLQKARTKKIINKIASTNRENPQKTKEFCVQG